MIRNLQPNEQVWRQLGVSDEHLRSFREIDEFRGFFITTHLQRFDVDLQEAPGIARFYEVDWRLLSEYSQTIGVFAKPHFLHLFDIMETGRRGLTLSGEGHNLMRTSNRQVASGDIDLADMYTFEVSPYELFSMAHVYRRDELPSLSPASGSEYQRPLIPTKLESIREKLLESPDFMFPNSILVVLSSDCRYLEEDELLVIPENYGAISVIDGQHRLFSYADPTVQERIGENSRIMVTAIQFQNTDEDIVREYSAKTFVEINTNQTRVHPTHLDAIAYELLGETHPRAIAAQVILRANERRGSLYGLFETNRTGLGVIQVATVLAALRTITRLEYIQGLQNAQSGSRGDRRQGYENLFGVEIAALGEPEILIERGVVCLEQFSNRVAQTFQYDWPERGQVKGSSLEYAKMIAGFVKLLRQFISEGLDWQAVQAELEGIRANIMQLRGLQDYDSVLFDPTHPDIPNARPSATDDYRFLNRNRQSSTSIQDVIAQERIS